MKSLSTVLEKKLKMNISKEEYLNDYENLDCLENKEKIDVANKYGTNSKKKKDILNAIALYAREERKTRKEYDGVDVTMFGRLDWSERNFINYISEESIEFQKYYLQFLLEKIKKHKASEYIYAKNLNSYGLSSNDKMFIKRFQTLDSHLKESDMSVEDKLKADEITTLKNSIKARLEENLQEFHDELINQSKEFAKRRYNFIKNSREELINNPELDSNKALRTRFSKVSAFLAKFKTIESFIDECVKDAEADFNKNINLIVERIFDKELDVANINCSSPVIDNNRINLVVTDGKKRLYCRAIIAAEFSAVMVPHVRFIVTEKK
jgi:hypothetical protein